MKGGRAPRGRVDLFLLESNLQSTIICPASLAVAPVAGSLRAAWIPRTRRAMTGERVEADLPYAVCAPLRGSGERLMDVTARSASRGEGDAEVEGTVPRGPGLDAPGTLRMEVIAPTKLSNRNRRLCPR